MTLVLTAANKLCALQVSDTKITYVPRSLPSLLRCKSLVVQCRDANICIAFAGRAELDGESVDRWLAKRLERANQEAMYYTDVVGVCRDELNRSRRRNRSLDRFGLSLVIGCLGQSLRGRIEFSLANVSNYQRPAAKSNAFEEVDPKGRDFAHFIISPERHIVMATGSVDNSSPARSTVREIIKRLRGVSDPGSARSLLQFMAKAIQLASAHGNYRGLIGTGCVAVLLLPDGRFEVAHYGLRSVDNLRPLVINKSGESLQPGLPRSFRTAAAS